MPVIDIWTDERWLTSGSGWYSASFDYEYPQIRDAMGIVTMDGFNEQSGNSAIRCAITAYRYFHSGGFIASPSLPGINNWKVARRSVRVRNLTGLRWTAQAYDCKEALFKFQLFIFEW